MLHVYTFFKGRIYSLKLRALKKKEVFFFTAWPIFVIGGGGGGKDYRCKLISRLGSKIMMTNEYKKYDSKTNFFSSFVVCTNQKGAGLSIVICFEKGVTKRNEKSSTKAKKR